MRRLLVLGSILALKLLIISTMIPTANADEELLTADEETVEIDYYWFNWFTGEEGETILVEVSSDQPVDVFLMDGTDFDEFEGVMNGSRETFHYYIDGSKMDTKGVAYSFDLPSTQLYYVVVDNTDVPDDGAYAQENATVSLKISIEDHVSSSNDSPGFEVFGVIGAVTVLVAIIAWKRRR